MSRLAKKPILIPQSVEVSKEGKILMVKGPKGNLQRDFVDDIKIIIDDNDKEIKLSALKNSKKTKSLLGTYVRHIENMIKGVLEGYEKKMIIEGIGYRAQIDGGNLVLNLGLSHPIIKKIPDGLKVTVDKNIISISGCDKDLVGQFSAEVRMLKKPEPYKGKGIRYEDEVIKRKAGKKAVSSS